MLIAAWTATSANASPGIPMCASELPADPLQTLYPSIHAWPAKEMCGPLDVLIPAPTPKKLLERSVDAYRRATALVELGSLAEARLQLDLAAQGLPRISDVVKLKQAELAMRRRRPLRAAALFEQALDTVSDDVRLRARTGWVEALQKANDPRALPALEQLLWDYPDHPKEAELVFEAGAGLTRIGQTDAAATFFRRIVVEMPESALADAALEQLKKVQRLEWSTDERIRRAQQLVQRGPLSQAQQEVDALVHEAEALTETQQMRVYWLAARLARYAADWPTAHGHMQQALRAPVTSDALRRRLEERASAMETALKARDPKFAARRVRRSKAGRAPHRASPEELVYMIGVAAGAGLKTDAERGMRALLRARKVEAEDLMSSGMAAIGVADAQLVERTLQQAWKIGSSAERPAATYHLGRLREQAGDVGGAKALYRRAIRESDDTGLRYHGMWAELALRRLDGTAMQPAAAEGFLDIAGPQIPNAPTPDTDELAKQITDLGHDYRDAYPWFGRAEELFRVREADMAQSELFQGYIAYRQARGRHIARAGINSVARGADRTRVEVPEDLRDARNRLDREERAALTHIAKEIGDWGLAGGFTGPDLVRSRPRAYEWLVVPAANRYGLDPNLLLAVMRVESVYQKRIVSYAGAVGLMQIMPRTGRLIAQALERDDFTPSDLLDPATNIEFAAWYLASLIRKFDGRLPLAIAAYNGGPHNVRRWMRDHHKDLPLDALLERIPFEQTHRYVRRVLVHYESYRAQQGLPMQQLSTILPAERIDPLSF